jgi:4-carboxymuconolactone decarboxylase
MEEPEFYDYVPQFSRMRQKILYDDLWQQPELSPRDRSLVTCAILGALGKQFELNAHMNKALSNGVTPDELRGLVAQLAIYAGWPSGVNAAQVGMPIFKADMQRKK